MRYVTALPGETAEYVCHGLTPVFAHMGMVPNVLVFDNATGVGHRNNDPLYRCRRALLKTARLRTDRQKNTRGCVAGRHHQPLVEAHRGRRPENHQLLSANRQMQGPIPDGRTHRITRRQRYRPRMPRTGHARSHPEETHERHPRLLRPRTPGERTHRSHQRQTRNPERHRPQIPQPLQLHHPQPATHRRIQTNHPNPPLTKHPYTPKREEPKIHWRGGILGCAITSEARFGCTFGTAILSKFANYLISFNNGTALFLYSHYT